MFNINSIMLVVSKCSENPNIQSKSVFTHFFCLSEILPLVHVNMYFVVVMVFLQWWSGQLGERWWRRHGRWRFCGDCARLSGSPGWPTGPRAAEIPETSQRSARTHTGFKWWPSVWVQSGAKQFQMDYCPKSSCPALNLTLSTDRLWSVSSRQIPTSCFFNDSYKHEKAETSQGL